MGTRASSIIETTAIHRIETNGDVYTRIKDRHDEQKKREEAHSGIAMVTPCRDGNSGKVVIPDTDTGNFIDSVPNLILQMRVSLVKQYAWIKEEMMKTSAESIADDLYANGRLSRVACEAICHCYWRRDAVEKLLKQILMGPNDIFKQFLQSLHETERHIAETLENTEPTPDEVQVFKLLEKSSLKQCPRPDHTDPRFFLTDSDCQTLLFYLNDKNTIDVINNFLLSRFFFSIREHNTICVCSMCSEGRVGELLNTMKLCSDNIFSSLSEIFADMKMEHVTMKLERKRQTAMKKKRVKGMLGSLERYLKKHKYSCSVISGLPKTREAPAAKQKHLKSMGKGNKPRAAEALSASDIDRLFETHRLGSHTPASVINTQWFNNRLYFGMRASTEHRAMMWGDVDLKTDHGLKFDYLEFHERATKTRTGENIRDTRTCPPRMYATPQNPERCPVAAYRFFEARRPVDICSATDPYYIAPVTNNSSPGIQQKWFLRGPIGHNKLNTMMKEMAKKADLPTDKTITNTSVGKTLVQRMTDCNVPDNLQVYETDYKRPESLSNYRQLRNVHKRQISSLLTSNSAIPQHGARKRLPPSSTVQSMPSFLPAPASGFPTSSPTPLISPPRNTSVVGI